MFESGKRKSAGVIAYERGDYDEALAFFLERLAQGRSKRPESVWSWIGACHVRLGRFDEAIEAFETAQDLGNEHPDLMVWWSIAMINVGYRHYEREDYSLALAYFEAALEIDDGAFAAELWYWIGVCHYDRRDFRDARDALARSIAINSEGEIARNWWECAQRLLSQELYQQQRYAEAIEGFQSVVAQRNLDPAKLAGVTAWIGACYQRTEDYHRAMSAYEQALELIPDHARFKELVGYLLALAPVDELRDGERAVKLATELCQLADPPKWEHVTLLAAAEAEVGNFEAAVPIYESALAMMPEEERSKRDESIERLRSGMPLRCSAAFDHARSPSGIRND